MQTSKQWVELRKGKVQWYVRLMARNGNVILTSQRYFSKGNAKRAAQRLADELSLPVFTVEGN